MSFDQFAAHAGVSAKSARNWESGLHHPVSTSKRLLDHVHERLTPQQRRRLEDLLAPPAKAPVESPPGAESLDDAAELARATEASHISSATLETLERDIDRFARDYPTCPPSLLMPRVQVRLRQIRHLLDGKLTLTQHRRLLIHGGWLTALLSNLQFDVGDRQAAEASRDVAYQLGNESGERELVAWTFEFLAWFALVQERFRDSLEYSQAGYELSPHTSAGVQLAVQEARAWARIGDRNQAEAALRRGTAKLSRLPTPPHPEHHFVFDPTKLLFYATMIYAWLGEHEKAEIYAQEVIAQCVRSDGTIRWPTRLAIARLDLGIVFAQRNEPDIASQLGVEALRTGRVVSSTLGWFADLDRALLANHREVREVRDFHEQYTLARIGIDASTP